MTVTEPKARRAAKPHRCWWCGEAIAKGETFVGWTCFDDGRANGVRVHPECKRAWDRLWHEDHYAAEENVGFGDYSRGCTCENGRCECVPSPAPSDGAASREGGEGHG